MILVETTQAGFNVSVDGRRLLSHSRRTPCVAIGRSEGAVRLPRGADSPKRRRASSDPLRSYKIVETSPDFASIDFEGRLRISLRSKDGRLRITFSGHDAATNYFRMRLVAWPDERIYGCGDRAPQRGESLDRKGEMVPLWVQDSGAIGVPTGLFSRLGAGRARRNAEGAHFPLPVFLSSRGYWCAVDTSAYTVLDFRRRAVTVLESWAVPHELVLGFGGDAPVLLSGMTSLLGRQPEPPAWCFDGVCLGLSGGSESVERKLDEALGAGVKVASVWIQDWCGRRAPVTGLPKDWTKDGGLYPDLAVLASRLRDRGFRCLGSIGPLLPAGGRLYAEASAAGLCVKDAEGRDYLLRGGTQTVAMVDLSGEAGLVWMKELIKREILGAGMSGWVADYGEELPVDAVLASGESAVRAHNRWPVLWAKVNREALEESGRAREAFFVMRSGWLGAARQMPAFFSGERGPGFSRRDGLPCIVPAALSLGLSGVGFWHPEMGGTPAQVGRRQSKECRRRLLELAAFAPFFRAGESTASGASPKLRYDAETVALLARMSEIYAALKPYHAAVAAEYSTEGLPPLRHPWIHYGSDPRAHELAYQYLYGRDLMIAPALSPSRDFTELYLPRGEWIHLWTSRSFGEGQVAVESPPGCPAAFYRAESDFAPLFDAIRRTVRQA
jgi:alpha-glucosidase